MARYLSRYSGQLGGGEFAETAVVRIRMPGGVGGREAGKPLSYPIPVRQGWVARLEVRAEGPGICHGGFADGRL